MSAAIYARQSWASEGGGHEPRISHFDASRRFRFSLIEPTHVQVTTCKPGIGPASPVRALGTGDHPSGCSVSRDRRTRAWTSRTRSRSKSTWTSWSSTSQWPTVANQPNDRRRRGTTRWPRYSSVRVSPDAEGAESKDLHIALVGHVIDSSQKVERRPGAVFGDDVINPADIDVVVRAVPGKADRFELARDHVGLGEQARGADGVPRQPEIEPVRGHPSQRRSGRDYASAKPAGGRSSAAGPTPKPSTTQWKATMSPCWCLTRLSCWVSLGLPWRPHRPRGCTGPTSWDPGGPEPTWWRPVLTVGEAVDPTPSSRVVGRLLVPRQAAAFVFTADRRPVSKRGCIPISDVRGLGAVRHRVRLCRTTERWRDRSPRATWRGRRNNLDRRLSRHQQPSRRLHRSPAHSRLDSRPTIGRSWFATEGRCRDIPQRPGLDENRGFPRAGNETGSRHQWQDSPPSPLLSARTLQQRPLRVRRLFFAWQPPVRGRCFPSWSSSECCSTARDSKTFATLEKGGLDVRFAVSRPAPRWQRRAENRRESGDREDFFGRDARLSQLYCPFPLELSLDHPRHDKCWQHLVWS